MRKIVCAIVLMTMLGRVVAQAKNSSHFEIKTNLLNLVAAGPSGGLEYSLKNNWNMMLSIATGHINYGDFGGITKYKTITLEGRKYFSNKTFIGPYIKNIGKEISSQKSVTGGTIPYAIGRDRDFTGNGLSAGATTGIKFFFSPKINLELNSQLGYGHFYRMADRYNLPSGNYLDARLGLWLGFGF